MFFKLFSRILDVLEKTDKKKVPLVIMSLLLNAILDLLGIAIFIPLMIIVIKNDPDFFIIRFVVEKLKITSPQSILVFFCVAIFIFILLKNLFSYFLYRFQSSFVFNVFSKLTTTLHREYYSYGFTYFKSRNSVEIVRDVYTLSAWFSQSVLLSLLSLITEVTIMTLLLITILYYQPIILVILSLVVLPATFSFYQVLKKKVEAIQREKSKLSSTTHRELFQSIHGYTDVKINLAEKAFFKKYQDAVTKTTDVFIKDSIYKILPQKLIETASIFGILSIVIYGSYSFENKEDLITLLGGLALAAYKIMPSINKIMASILSIKGYAFTLDVMDKVKTSREEDLDEETPLTFNTSIAVESIKFSYSQDEQYVVNNLNLTIKKGERMGVIGKSGSGKTTLMNLLLGFLEPSSGVIKIDGVLLEDSNLRAWREKIGYVQQELYLVDATLAENIAFGKNFEDIDLQILNRVIEEASLSELVASLPNGYLTEVGERGASLSGGQRQRVGIARALYAGAEILFFDEATSALDSDTEGEITDAIDKLSGNITIIMIAHRLTSLKHCDRIISMKDGEISKITTYELL
jgi:ABC-type bacteriocin/lantibiotic exporter with double-glycine peptidase domain